MDHRRFFRQTFYFQLFMSHFLLGPFVLSLALLNGHDVVIVVHIILVKVIGCLSAFPFGASLRFVLIVTVASRQISQFEVIVVFFIIWLFGLDVDAVGFAKYVFALFIRMFFRLRCGGE